MQESEDYRIFRQMINSFYIDEQEHEKNKTYVTNKIKLEPKVIYSNFNKDIKVEFKIGDNQMYKIRNVVDFYEKMLKGEKGKYGQKLNFVHIKENFDIESHKFLDFLMKYGEIIKYANDSTEKYYTSLLSNSYIVLSNTGMDDFFETCKDKEVEFSNERGNKKIKFIDKQPEIIFEVINKNNNEYKLITKEDIYDFRIIYGRKYIYYLQKDCLYKCDKKFERTTLKLLNVFKSNFITEIPFKKSELQDFYSLIMQEIDNVKIDKLDKQELKTLLPKDLKVKVFLDYDKKNHIVADIKFIYDNVEFNPFEELEEKIARNAIQESRTLDIFKNTGFMFDSNNRQLILADEEKIYDFLKSGIEEYISKFEIMATNRFKEKQIIIPKINSIGVKIENNLLNIDLSEFDFDKTELEEIMKKYKLNKKFHRLKNGQFVDLKDNQSLDTLEKIVESSNIDYKELTSDNIKLPIYRSLYLDKILKQNEINIKQSDEYKKLIDDVYDKQTIDKYELPKNLKINLREYQKVGYDWLKTIDDYKLGGILADDMGLGKTIQVLAIVLDYLEKSKNRKPSLVICPSSLCLNWYEEIKKFTPEINAKVVYGNQEERENIIKNMYKYDLVITSYDLLKRDLDIYKDYDYIFRYVIADEAQYIKNSNTKNAKAIKEINAITKYALTGTPIENSLAELWSIFDFIMPGYLFSYNKFKMNFETPIIKEESSISMQKLKSMIEPFILRRVKEKVLTELPEKTITILNNEMEDEQLKLYLAYMKQAKKEAKEEIEENGVANSQIKILALLMRLRQICCHPSLFIDNYDGKSSKLEQCIEIIKNAISGGHKILLFSGYSSMFKYIEKELNNLNISYYKLTGQTKVNDRMDLVNDFNKNDDIKVFLISLKAGGTGLNLIGADMVIHYDPWWNLSAENQATDRTYRIGQKKNVQVYKLITKNSIEEKIYNLQEKKAKLANDMLSTRETFISKLTEDEILNLFE